MKKGPKVRTLEARFWEKVKKTEGCWEWTAGCFIKDGYGQFRRGTQSFGAHRISWELHNGPIPEDMCVLHDCDNRLCVRPDHLFLGSRADNNADRNRKGRQAKGEAQGSAKLTKKQIQEIRLYLAQGVCHRIIAKHFGVHKAHISRINTGKQWRHV